MRFDNKTNQIKPRVRFFFIFRFRFSNNFKYKEKHLTTQEESKKKVIKCKCFFLLSSCCIQIYQMKKFFFAFNFFDLVIFLRRIEYDFPFFWLCLFGGKKHWNVFLLCAVRNSYIFSEGSNLLYLFIGAWRKDFLNEIYGVFE